jgi:hypothetical protein
MGQPGKTRSHVQPPPGRWAVLSHEGQGKGLDKRSSSARASHSYRGLSHTGLHARPLA